MIKVLIAGRREFTDSLQAQAQQLQRQAEHLENEIRVVSVSTEPSTTVEVLEKRGYSVDAVIFGFDDSDIEIMVDIVTRNQIGAVIFVSSDNPAAAFRKWAKYKIKVAIAGNEIQTVQKYFKDRPVKEEQSLAKNVFEDNRLEQADKVVEVVKEREDRNRVVAVDKKTIVIYGPKGGVGKTTTTVSLARSLVTLTNMRVAILDLDMNRDYGDVIRYFRILGDMKATAINIKPEDTEWVKGLTVPTEKTLSAWSQFPREMYHDRRLVDSCLIKIKDHNNLYILPPFRSLADAKPIDYALVQKVMEVLRRHFGVVLVDGGNTLSTPTLAAMEASDEIIILSTAELAVLDSLADFTANMFNLIQGNPTISLVINNVPADCPYKLEYELPKITKGYPAVALFPRDEQLSKMSTNDANVPYLGCHDTPYTREMEKLLYHIFPKEVFAPRKENKVGLLSRIMKRFMRS